MGISPRELLAQLSPDVAALSADALAELDAPRRPAAPGKAAPAPAAQTIVLALPPSANRYWSYGRGGVHVSEEAAAYKTGVAWKARYEGFRPMTDPVAVYANVYRPRKAGDLDNYAKVLLDSLNGVAYTDDAQIVELHLWRHDDKRNPRVEVEIRSVPCSA